MDARWARGVAEFNAGNFFAAHETWEELWNETVDQEKLFLQGLVQVAAGYAKVETGIRGGALKLLERGGAQLRRFLPAAHGLTLEPIVAAIAADLERLRAADGTIALDIVRPPQLHLG